MISWILLAVAHTTHTGPSLPSLGTLVAVSTIASAIIAYAAYRVTKNSEASKAAAEGAQRNADLIRAEHDGWSSLLDNMREQYDRIVSERETLLELIKHQTEELKLLNQTQIDLATTRAELADTTAKLRIAERQIEDLQRILGDRRGRDDDPQPGRPR